MEPDCVCTSLRMATRSVNRLYDRALAPTGLRVTGYSILSHLARHGPLSVTELASLLAMDRTTCTREVAPLVRTGLVKRTTGADRRARLLQLTEHGERKHAEAYPRWEQVQRSIGDAFGTRDVADLLTRLRRLRANTDQLIA